MSMQEILEGLRNMASMMDFKEDYLTIVASEEQKALRAAAREKELDIDRATLKEASRALKAARTSSTRPPTVPSAEQHAETLSSLDAERLTTAKDINKAESRLASNEAELTRLKEEARALEESDPAAEHGLDGTMLRLQIYRGLGFEPVLDREGRLEKMLVQSSSGDIHFVKLDKRKSDQEEQESAELLWRLASS